jgi:plasmid maintenance system antidote protein VapI
MAIRLEKAGWSNADFWLRLQVAYDLARVRKRQHQIKVERDKPLTSASPRARAATLRR